ncbi:MAG: hypothetical protein Kow00122_12720 [Thermoleophilia bacterium]
MFVSGFGDAQLGLKGTGTCLPRAQSQVGTDRTALREALGVFHGEDVDRGGEGADARHLGKKSGLRVALPGHLFDLRVESADLVGELRDDGEDRRQRGGEFLGDAGPGFPGEDVACAGGQTAAIGTCRSRGRG